MPASREGHPAPASWEDAASLKEALAAFVAERFSVDMALKAWREVLFDTGWAVPSWSPRHGGRDLGAWADQVVARELVALGSVGVPVGSGTALAGPTIVAHGPEATAERFVRPLLTGAESWCQLFSEPGAGSDLAGLTTTAEVDGDEWVVSGQKVWNTGARTADLAMLLVRTDWSAPKHRGLTYLVLPMRQDGVEVRPLRQMNGYASFNEVFLTEARVPKDHVVGAVGHGWAAARTTLAHERRFAALRPPPYDRRAGRALEEARAEAEAHFATYRWYPQRAGRADLVVPHARQRAPLSPVARQGVAGVIAAQRVGSWTAERAAAGRDQAGGAGPEGSVGKLALSALARRSAATHAALAGPGAMLAGPTSPLEGTVAEILVSVPAQSIAGGTDEIQRSIIGERTLGLPREPSADDRVPFRALPRNL
jgi:alkylation response protein AidB-like acyl-CoA dehydrogenase